MCAIHAPSGNEIGMTEFILEYIQKNQHTWKVQPTIYYGSFQDTIVLVFGEPRTAIYAHMDSIGFTVRYGKELVKIGGPQTHSGFILSGKDSQGGIICELQNESELEYKFEREIERGTELVFKADWREDDSYIQCCYMDNRLGVFNALKVCEDLENGAIAFTCWEEHGKGSTSVAGRFLYEQFGVTQALISDISWITEGVHPGMGPVISMRDSGIPRRSYVNRIIKIARETGIPFQLEVEGSGGSDGIELQHTPYPIDWCFVGAAEQNVHSPDEKVHKKDAENMILLYKELMKAL